MPTSWESQLDQCIAKIEQDLVAIRRHLHAHPEPSGAEVETSRFVARRLKEAGLSSRLYENDLGVSADLVIGRPRDDAPLVAVRADLDALRMPDEKTVPYRSQVPNVAHACGHDAHTAMVLGIALSAAQWNHSPHLELPNGGVRMRLIFQPAEETSAGARWLVEQNVLDGVDVILAAHVDPERLAGQVGIRYGLLTANCDEVHFEVCGRGGHAARPHHSIDPLAAAAQLISALYQSLPRSIDSRYPAVFTIGQIAGGYAPNVIPERVSLWGSLRTTDNTARETLKRRIAEIADGIEEVSGARIAVEFGSPLEAVHNDPRVAAVVEEAARRVVGAENVDLIEHPSMGGEDFSVYLEHVPGTLMRLGCASPGNEPTFLHSPVFDIDERILAFGTRILTRAAVLLAEGLHTTAQGP